MIPERFTTTCEFCNHQIDTRAPGVYQYTKGWVMNRAGGGGHGVSLPERELRWAHAYCIRRRTDGTFGQTNLFGGNPVPKPPREPQPTNAAFNGTGKFVHCCNVCGGDAWFGIGVAINAGDLGLWYCTKHRPIEEGGYL